MENSNVRNIIVAAISGMVAGMAIGFLLSPNTGQENREYIVKGFKTAKNKADNVIDKARDTMSRVRTRGGAGVESESAEPVE